MILMDGTFVKCTVYGCNKDAESVLTAKGEEVEFRLPVCIHHLNANCHSQIIGGFGDGRKITHMDKFIFPIVETKKPSNTDELIAKWDSDMDVGIEYEGEGFSSIDEVVKYLTQGEEPNQKQGT